MADPAAPPVAPGGPIEPLPDPAGPSGRQGGRWFAVHPLMAATLPVLVAWRGVGATRTSLLTAVALASAGVLIAWGLTALALRWSGASHAVVRAALGATLVTAPLLSAGAVPIDTPVLGGALVATVVAVAVAVVRLVPDRVLGRATTALNLLGVVLLLPVLVGVVPALLPQGARPTLDLPGAAAPARDIFYVIPDRYPRADTLAEAFDFDNGPFLDGLRERGFTIQDRARANYPRTSASLAATWQFDYVQELLPDTPPGDQWGPIYQLIGEQRLGPTLVGAGFDHIHVGTWWPPTALAISATENRTLDTATSFHARLADQSAWRWIRPPAPLPEPGTRAHHRAVSDFQFAELERLAREVGPRPRLVVAHVTVPHEPYVYDADGSWVTAKQEAARSRTTNTLNQVEFANDRLTHLVDLLVTGDPATDPIVVIQSDEGPHPARQEELRAEMDWFTATTDERAEKLRTLSAWYLPGIDEEPPDDITGVNTWRWILDRYLGTEFGLLPDRVWVYRDQDHAYDYLDVTDEFE